MSKQQSPRGIRNNNPGNLRRYTRATPVGYKADGFWVFPTATAGLIDLFILMRNYYTHLGLKTLPAFISRYAPASENDTVLYISRAAQWLPPKPTPIAKRDLRLDTPNAQIDLARAIIAIENGIAPPERGFDGEWFSIQLIAGALAVSRGHI